MITELDLRETLAELADLAPDECGSFHVTGPTRPTARSKHAFAALAGALVAAAVVASIAVGASVRHSDHNHRSPAGHNTQASAPSISPQVRAALIALARADAAANDDPAASADAVLTTYQRLQAKRPQYFAMLAAAAVRQKRLPGPADPLWVVQLRGTFDDGNTVITTFINGATLQELVGTAGAEPTETARRELAQLGAVIHLY